MFETFSRIEALAKKQGISLQKVAIDIGLSENYIYKLKTKKTANTDPIEKIADYFKVSTDYLLARTDNPNTAENAVIDGHVVDLRKAAANTMLFDGKKLDEDDIEFITAVLSAHFKNKK